jgi:hypothetical protein
MLSRKQQAIIATIAFLAATCMHITDARATAWSYGITTESVDNYGCGGCNQDCDGDDLCNSNANCSGFMTQMTTDTSNYFSSFVDWTDANVYDSDFVDPDTGHCGRVWILTLLRDLPG